MPTIQLLGSAASAVNTASSATATSSGQSPFAAVMSGILGQPAGAMSASVTANSSESGSSTGSIISFEQLQQLSPELAAALNGSGSADGLAALAGKLAALLSEMGEGKLVPLSAGLDLSQLIDAGIELPEGLENALQGGQAVILIDQDALKQLLAGGGWKEGMEVPVMLMAESGDAEQPGVVLIDSMLEAVKQTDETTGKSTLQFQLTFDLSTTINLDASGEAPAADAAQGDEGVVRTPLLADIADAIAWLKAVAEAGDDENSDDAQVSGESPADALSAFLGHKSTSEAAETDSETGDAPAVSEVEDAQAAQSSGSAPQTESDEDAEEKAKELEEKINDLISALLGATGRDRTPGAQPLNNIERIATALEMVAGQVASLGDSESAKRTLEMIGKLSNLSSLGEGEKQQVLSELASSLSSLLENVESKDTASRQSGDVLPPAAKNSVNSEPVAAMDAALTGAADSQPATSVDVKPESGSVEKPGTVKADVPADNMDKTNTAVQNAAPTDSTRNLLATLEAVAAAAGELADAQQDGKQAVKAGAEVRQSEMLHPDKLADRIAGVLKKAVTTPQTSAASSENTSTTQQTAPTDSKPAATAQAAKPVAEAATAATTDSKAMDKPAEQTSAQSARDDKAATASGEKQTRETTTVKTDSLATALAADSESQKVTVPVSLSSLNKTKKEQSKVRTSEAVNAFSSNSKSASRTQGEGNDFMKAMRAAAGEKGMSDLVEATVVEKKAGAVEALGRTEGADADQKPGGVQVQGGIRAEQTGGRVTQLRGEIAQQARTVETANQSEAFEKIINSARLTKAGATTELTMKLEPDHLGMMRVKMSVDDQKVMHASIQVESNEARTMIESNLHRLRESLAEQGIKVEKFSVDVRQDQQQTQQQSAGAGREGQWQQTGQGSGRGSSGSTGAAGGGVAETESATGTSNARVHKYDYSTLEWVA